MRWLVVGFGSIGQRHLANLTLADAGEIEGCDSNSESCALAKNRWGVPVTQNLDEALGRHPDVVFVCTPTATHLTVAIKAAQAGSHLFIEKPLDVDLSRMEALVKLLAQSGKKAFVGCNLRFHPGVAALKQLLNSGRLGKPLLAASWFRHYLPNWRPGMDYRKTYSASSGLGGGIIFESVHELDYLRTFFGEITEVSAKAERLSDLEIDSEDTASMRLNFSSGTVATVDVDYLSPVKLRGCEIIGSDGIAQWISDGKAPEKLAVRFAPRASARWEAVVSEDTYDGNEMYQEELRRLIAVFSGEHEEGLQALDEAVHVLQAALAARLSAKENTRISIRSLSPCLQ